jgi:tryptophan synthase alpha chain
MLPRECVTAALTKRAKPTLIAYVTAGYPDPDTFLDLVRHVSSAADAVEIGVPFSDPMADGVTIQRSSRHAIERGVTLRWIFTELARRDFELASPVLLMTYLNPLLAYGYEALAARAAEVGVAGFIVPDLPYEERAPLAAALDSHGLALVQLVTPATPPERLRMICAGSQGFVYAVTKTGITGAGATLPAELASYLDTVKRASRLPVCAGFGVRDATHVQSIGAHADGVIVGSALVEALERGEDAAAFLRELRGRQ